MNRLKNFCKRHNAGDLEESAPMIKYSEKLNNNSSEFELERSRKSTHEIKNLKDVSEINIHNYVTRRSCECRTNLVEKIVKVPVVKEKIVEKPVYEKLTKVIRVPEYRSPPVVCKVENCKASKCQPACGHNCWSEWVDARSRNYSGSDSGLDEQIDETVYQTELHNGFESVTKKDPSVEIAGTSSNIKTATAVVENIEKLKSDEVMESNTIRKLSANLTKLDELETQQSSRVSNSLAGNRATVDIIPNEERFPTPPARMVSVSKPSPPVKILTASRYDRNSVRSKSEYDLNKSDVLIDVKKQRKFRNCRFGEDHEGRRQSLEEVFGYTEKPKTMSYWNRKEE